MADVFGSAEQRGALFIDAIVARRREAMALRQVPLADLRRAAEAVTPPALPLEAWRSQRGQSLRVIAEYKRRSPSAGPLRPDPSESPVAVVRGYAAAGAVLASVLTDGPAFGGSLADLRAVAAAGDLPALRKDFLLDEYDLLEARLAGAAAVLLIVRVFPDRGELAALVAQAHALGLCPLVEAHDRAEAEAARAAGAQMIGINHRDLQTLRTDLSSSAGLREALGEEPLLVAESGLRSAADLAQMIDRGMDAALIGESLLRRPDPGAALADLLSGLSVVKPAVL